MKDLLRNIYPENREMIRYLDAPGTRKERGALLRDFLMMDGAFLCAVAAIMSVAGSLARSDIIQFIYMLCLPAGWFLFTSIIHRRLASEAFCRAVVEYNQKGLLKEMNDDFRRSDPDRFGTLGLRLGEKYLFIRGAGRETADCVVPVRKIRSIDLTGSSSDEDSGRGDSVPSGFHLDIEFVRDDHKVITIPAPLGKDVKLAAARRAVTPFVRTLVSRDPQIRIANHKDSHLKLEDIAD